MLTPGCLEILGTRKAASRF
jgi:hypothetical protein